jgi:hypothetical protein
VFIKQFLCYQQLVVCIALLRRTLVQQIFGQQKSTGINYRCFNYVEYCIAVQECDARMLPLLMLPAS